MFTFALLLANAMALSSQVSSERAGKKSGRGGNVHVLVVSDVDTRPDLSVSTTRAGGRLGAKTDEVEETVSLDGLLELALLSPESGRVLKGGDAGYQVGGCSDVEIQESR